MKAAILHSARRSPLKRSSYRLCYSTVISVVSALKSKSGYTDKAFLGSAVILLVLCTLICNTAAQTPIPPPAGLVGWWPGDGNGEDVIGGNEGTLQNGAAFASGLVGQAFSLNGVNQYVLVSPAPALNVTPTSSITVTAWVLRTIPGVPQHIVGKREGCGPGGSSYALIIDTFSSVAFGGSAENTGLGSGVDLTLNRWTQVAGTFDGAAGRWSVYIDGVLMSSTTDRGTLGQVDSAPLEIGSSGTCIPFGGLIDEVQIYNRALSATEIQAIFNAGSAGMIRPPTLPQCVIQLDQCQADLAAGEQEIQALVAQVVALTTQNAQLQQELQAAQDQLAQLDQCRADLAAADQRIHALEGQVDALTTQNAELHQELQAVQSQLAQLTTTIGNGLTGLTADLRSVFDDPEFLIPGATLEEQYQTLIAAILNLNRGRKEGLYVNLSSGTHASVTGKTTGGRDVTATDARQTVGSGSPKAMGEEQTEVSPPEAYVLHQNHPNPFNPETEIRFQLPEASHVVVKIFSTVGTEIRTLVDAPYQAGYHSMHWDGKDENGNPAASGLYLCQFRAGSFSQVKKMSLLR